MKWLLLYSFAVHLQINAQAQLCKPLTISTCQGIGYNRTSFPNTLSHQNQEEAGVDVNAFKPLIKIGCSPHTRLFVCSIYTPVCTILSEPISPCRSVCESVESGCKTLMKKFGFDWPENFNCTKYPSSPELCVGAAPNASPTVSQVRKETTTVALSTPPLLEQRKFNDQWLNLSVQCSQYN